MQQDSFSYTHKRPSRTRLLRTPTIKRTNRSRRLKRTKKPCRGGHDIEFKTSSGGKISCENPTVTPTTYCQKCNGTLVMGTDWCRICGKIICIACSTRVEGKGKCHTVCTICKHNKDLVPCPFGSETLSSQGSSLVRTVGRVASFPIKTVSAIIDTVTCNEIRPFTGNMTESMSITRAPRDQNANDFKCKPFIHKNSFTSMAGYEYTYTRSLTTDGQFGDIDQYDDIRTWLNAPSVYI